uniref:Uncharacterized protein n=1 Tax=Anopheles atroparvus TaxID=41427 RepID=A0AAG5D6A8_ANOAO
MVAGRMNECGSSVKGLRHGTVKREEFPIDSHGAVWSPEPIRCGLEKCLRDYITA